MTKQNWIKRSHLAEKNHIIPQNIHKWLVTNNLTETIKKTGANFSLNLLSQSFDNPYCDEALIFQDFETDASYSLVRKVFLEGNNQPLVFARVIIPEKTYLNYHTEFSNLGLSAIGNTLLYSNKEVVRQDFEYKLIKDDDDLSIELSELNQLIGGDGCWARRSIFVLPKGPLLISEVFLDTIQQYPLSHETSSCAQ